jgi:hypothetical protein
MFIFGSEAVQGYTALDLTREIAEKFAGEILPAVKD